MPHLRNEHVYGPFPLLGHSDLPFDSFENRAGQDSTPDLSSHPTEVNVDNAVESEPQITRPEDTHSPDTIRNV